MIGEAFILVGRWLDKPKVRLVAFGGHFAFFTPLWVYYHIWWALSVSMLWLQQTYKAYGDLKAQRTND